MLEKILNYLNNDFRACDLSLQNYTITGGTISLDGVKDFQYVRIYGSLFNDGVYQYPLYGLTDETFRGYIIPLAIPKEVLDLAEAIEEYEKKNQPTAFTSESFGGYSYSKATKANGTAAGWREVFADELRPYKKMKQH